MNQLIDILKPEDIPHNYQRTPIGLILEYHNLGRPMDDYSDAQILIGTCIDHRINIRIPDYFSFIVRAGGANMKNNEFKISFAIAIRGIKYIALIGHSDCGMVNLNSRKEQFIRGLVNNADWDKDNAEDHFTQFAPMFEIGNEIDFVAREAKRLRIKYPKIMIAPMLFKLDDNRLYLIREK
jgi:carbonic anhydrase